MVSRYGHSIGGEEFIDTITAYIQSKPHMSPYEYIVEHLDPELGPWSALEYQAIAQECSAEGATFCLSSVNKDLLLPQKLQTLSGLMIENRSVEDMFATKKDRICLLDPAAPIELGPKDASMFDTFLFGGILGDDPPRDRTSELRAKGYANRRLGPVQMTTDTAVRVTRTVIQKQVPLDSIPYIDHPEIRIDEHESTEMPFRYMKNEHGKPIMPEGMIDLIKQDAEKGIRDLF